MMGKIDPLMPAVLIALFFIMAALAELNALLENWHEEWQVVTEEGWTPREIPQCDKELWERITDGCDDEGHD